MKGASYDGPASTEGTVLIRGNTYPVRDQLKAMGGVWDPDERAWRVPKEKRMSAEVIVGNGWQVEQLPGLEDEERA